MFISHKKLLNWTTSEDAAKMMKNDIITYIKAFKFNYFISFLLLVTTISFSFKYKTAILLLIILFVVAPYVMWLVSRKNEKKEIALSEADKKELENIAYHTWTFFDDLLKPDTNYLIPDNFQENREDKVDKKTSPTDISMSITAIISAYALDFINKRTALEKLTGIIKTLEVLEKWNGHLYNWYRIDTLEKMYPSFVSSVDSANLAISILTLEQFLRELKEFELADRCEILFKNMDYSVFYTDDEVFSIGYDTQEDRLTPFNYNKFASESRILSFIAIIKGDVKSKHWFCLDKTLTKYKNHKGLVSWSGTSFEYFMPMLYMKRYSNTLLDESYNFAYFCQKEYMKEVNSSFPWGISESAYAELDDALNYKYKAFSTPYLKD